MNRFGGLHSYVGGGYNRSRFSIDQTFFDGNCATFKIPGGEDQFVGRLVRNVSHGIIPKLFQRG